LEFLKKILNSKNILKDFLEHGETKIICPLPFKGDPPSIVLSPRSINNIICLPINLAIGYVFIVPVLLGKDEKINFATDLISSNFEIPVPVPRLLSEICR
jgi:hypothetical protein